MATAGVSIEVGKNTFVLSKDGVVHVPIIPGYKPVVHEELEGTAGEPHKSADKTRLVFEQQPGAFVVVVVRDDRWREMRVIKPTGRIVVESLARVDIQLRPALVALVKGIKDLDFDQMYGDVEELAEKVNAVAVKVERKADELFGVLEKKLDKLFAEPVAPSQPSSPTDGSPAKPAGDKKTTTTARTSRRTTRRRTMHRRHSK